MTADSKQTNEKAPNADETRGKRTDELTDGQLDQIYGGGNAGQPFLRFTFGTVFTTAIRQ